MLTQYLAATVALASIVAAAPLEERSTFSIKQIPNAKMAGKQLTGPAQLVKTYQKYGAVVPGHIQAALATTGKLYSMPALLNNHSDQHLRNCHCYSI
jgi:hypothetical protein